MSINSTCDCRAVKECFLTDLNAAGYELTYSEGSTVSKCSVLDANSLGEATRIGDGLKLCTILEAADSEAGKSSVADNVYERSTVHKYLTFGYAESGDVSGKGYTLKSGTAVEQLIAKRIGSACRNAYAAEAYAVSEYTGCGKISYSCGDVCKGKSTSCVHTLSESGLSLELDHRGERGAVLKEVLSDGGEVGSSLSNCEVGQTATACKCTVADNGNAFGDIEACKLFTALECTYTNSGYGCGDLNVLKKLGVLECVCGDSCDVRGCGKNEGLELRACKCSAKNFVNAVGKSVGLCGIRCGIVDQSEHILIEQRTVLIDEGGIALSNAEGGDTRTVGEGVTCHSGKR